VVKSNTFGQIAGALEDLVNQLGKVQPDESQAIEEASAAVDMVLQTGKPVELNPQVAHNRRAQIQLAERKKLSAEAVGHEPDRHVRILPPGS
jgi:predicted RNA-binding protein Jag